MTASCNLRKHSEQRFCCGGCGRAFSAMASFDWHRRGGVCSDPSGGGFVAREIPGVRGSVTVWGVASNGPEWWSPSGPVTVP